MCKTMINDAVLFSQHAKKSYADHASCRLINTIAIFIFKGTRDIFEGDRIKFENSPNELKLLNKKASKDDAGRYTLTMKNEKGQDTISLNVVVVGKIFFISIKYYSLNTLRRRLFGHKTFEYSCCSHT